MDEDIIQFLRENRFMNIASDGVKLWISKVYYALDHGIIFFLEKNTLTEKNIEKTNNISFNIDENMLSIIVQGSGKVNVLGDPEDFKARTDVIIRKNPEDKQFIKHVELAELIPDFISITDLRKGFNKYNPQFSLNELTET
ncbi:pyridoxamine 5'-phosphate oxidase family protein [Ferroplasma sp.]|uniref:pyridoxamine 5'-phosphate oxidase family protein n=1 Tax=Ferroplasma sp. TaxID=2591003 RepID=UPI00307F6710